MKNYWLSKGERLRFKPLYIDGIWYAQMEKNTYDIEHHPNDNLKYHVFKRRTMEIGQFHYLEHALIAANKHNGSDYDFVCHCIDFKMQGDQITFSGKNSALYDIGYEPLLDEYTITYYENGRMTLTNNKSLYEAIQFVRGKEGL